METTQDDLVRAMITAGVTDERLIEAFRTILRDEFVPENARTLAYEDRPIAIPHDQVTTQPSLSAMMIEALDLTSSSRVLEVGTGLGFQTALLSRLGKTSSSKPDPTLRPKGSPTSISASVTALAAFRTRRHSTGSWCPPPSPRCPTRSPNNWSKEGDWYNR